MDPLDGVAFPVVLEVDPLLDPLVEGVAPLELPVLDVEPLPGRVVLVPESLRAVVPEGDPAGRPTCAPVFAPGAVGSHGASGVELWPV